MFFSPWENEMLYIDYIQNIKVISLNTLPFQYSN